MKNVNVLFPSAFPVDDPLLRLLGCLSWQRQGNPLHKESQEKNQDTIQLLIFKLRFFIRATDLRAGYIKKKGEHFL